MNILFVLYGGVETNSFICLSRFAKELYRRGYRCAVVLHGSMQPWNESYLRVYSPLEVLKNPQACFANERKADVIHAWTPRQNVCNFVLKYQAISPTPLFIYSEDDEAWIAQQWLQLSSQGIIQKIKFFFLKRDIPPCLSDFIQFRDFLGISDAAGIITQSLQKDFPTWLKPEVLLPGVDLEYFSPRVATPSLRKKYSLSSAEKLIVYCGGVNSFTGPNIRDLCQMVMLLNQRSYRCRLIRSGIGALSSITGIKQQELRYVLDLGTLPASEIPDLMSLADVFVQPGRPSPFEEGRLPCKIPEFMAMGIPTVLPHCNVALLMTHGEDALLHQTGLPAEMAACCGKIFQDFLLRDRLKLGARHFAEKHFDIQKKVDQLEQLYLAAQQQYQKNRSTLSNRKIL